MIHNDIMYVWIYIFMIKYKRLNMRRTESLFSKNTGTSFILHWKNVLESAHFSITGAFFVSHLQRIRY